MAPTSFMRTQTGPEETREVLRMARDGPRMASVSLERLEHIPASSFTCSFPPLSPSTSLVLPSCCATVHKTTAIQCVLVVGYEDVFVLGDRKGNEKKRVKRVVMLLIDVLLYARIRDAARPHVLGNSCGNQTTVKRLPRTEPCSVVL